MRLFSFVGGLVDRLCVIAGAFIGSQFPQFIQQYTQRLAGYVEALEKVVNELHRIASLSHKTLEQYIQKFRDSQDIDFIHQGDFMQETVVRWQEFYQILSELTQAPTVLKLYYFFKDLQLDIAKSTLACFQPGFSLTLEGVGYAAIGMILGWCFYQLALQLIALGYSRALQIFK